MYVSKRPQVILNDDEIVAIRKAAEARQTTVAEWVRQALRAARRREALGDVEKKIELVRAASRHSYPTGEVQQMLLEMERGYVAEDES